MTDDEAEEIRIKAEVEAGHKYRHKMNADQRLWAWFWCSAAVVALAAIAGVTTYHVQAVRSTPPPQMVTVKLKVEVEKP